MENSAVKRGTLSADMCIQHYRGDPLCINGQMTKKDNGWKGKILEILWKMRIQADKLELARFYERCADRTEYNRGEFAHQRLYSGLDA